jgi:hypothetical protein
LTRGVFVSSSARWPRSGLFFDNLAICLGDAGADGRCAMRGPEGDLLRGLGASAANCGTDEFMIATPIPGCGGNGIWDGKASPMIVFRLFLDARDQLN